MRTISFGRPTSIHRSGVGRKLLLAAAMLGLGSSPVRAEPIQAEAELPASQGGDSALQDRAILAARRAALATALESLPPQDGDATARRSVMSRFEIWTSSYRVLSAAQGPTGMVARVEVDIDVPRLQKSLMPQKDDSQAVFAWGRAHVGSQCTAAQLRDDAIEAALTQMGVLRPDAPQKVSMQLSCETLGPVSFTRFVAARVQARVKFGEREEQIARSGFALDPDRAQTAAYAELFNAIVDRMNADTALDLRIRVLEPWPASRLRHLERTLRESIPGVSSVALLGISGQGDAILSVKSQMDATQIAASLSSVQFPGFDIEELRVQSKRSMSIRWGQGPGDQPIDTASQPADEPQVL